MDDKRTAQFLVFDLGFEGVAQALASIPSQRTSAKTDGPCVHLASQVTRLRTAINTAKRELSVGHRWMALLALQAVDADPVPGRVNGYPS